MEFQTSLGGVVGALLATGGAASLTNGRFSGSAPSRRSRSPRRCPFSRVHCAPFARRLAGPPPHGGGDAFAAGEPVDEAAVHGALGATAAAITAAIWG